MSTLKYSVVDAFTTSPFKGNGAAVIVVDPSSPTLNDAMLQSIAAEFNLSETAFVTPLDSSKGKFALRWFTPKNEVALCGHATLASASVLFSSREHFPENVKTIEFSTMSGALTARELEDGRIELEFPAGETTAVDDVLRSKVIEVIQRTFPTKAQPDVRFVGTGHGIAFQAYMLIEVGGVDLEKVAVEPGAFSELAPRHHTILVTQQGRSTNETFASRVFAPVAGIPEDPVTGSAHCMIGPYWAKKLQIDVSEMLGRQVSPRSGVVGVVWDREKGTCRLRGHATLAAKGELYLPN